MYGTRKVQEIGRSLYISLPKSWASQMQLKRGDTVTLIPQQDGSVSVYPEETDEGPRQISLDVNEETGQSLVRRIRGAYVGGFDIIQLRTRSRFTDEQNSIIHQAKDELFGLEVVHAGSNVTTIECLLKPVLPIEKTIERINNIVQSMFDEAITALKEHDVELAESVPKRIRDIRRLSNVIYRALRSQILYPSLALKGEMNLIDSVDFLHVLHRMTRTGDNLKRISESTLKIGTQALPTSVTKPLDEAFNLAKKSYGLAIQALVSKSMTLADQVLDIRPDFEELLKCSLDANRESEISAVILSYIHRIIDSLAQIHQQTAEIAEIAIDRGEVDHD